MEKEYGELRWVEEQVIFTLIGNGGNFQAFKSSAHIEIMNNRIIDRVQIESQLNKISHFIRGISRDFDIIKLNCDQSIFESSSVSSQVMYSLSGKLISVQSNNIISPKSILTDKKFRCNYVREFRRICLIEFDNLGSVVNFYNEKANRFLVNYDLMLIPSNMDVLDLINSKEDITFLNLFKRVIKLDSFRSLYLASEFGFDVLFLNSLNK